MVKRKELIRDRKVRLFTLQPSNLAGGRGVAVEGITAEGNVCYSARINKRDEIIADEPQYHPSACLVMVREPQCELYIENYYCKSAQIIKRAEGFPIVFLERGERLKVFTRWGSCYCYEWDGFILF